jgi:MFS family permease
MLRDIIILIIGLLLLWIPRSWLRLGKPEKTRKRTVVTGGPRRDRLSGDHSLWIEEEFRHGRNWMDFGRALAGSCAVVTTLPVLLAHFVGAPGVSMTNVAFLTFAVVLMVSVVIQMLRVEERFMLYPPIFFILGLAFAVVGWKAAIIGFVAIWAINLVLPNPALFLAVYAAGITVVGVFFGSGMKPTLLMAGLAIIPPMVSVLSRRRLVQFRKKTKIASR